MPYCIDCGVKINHRHESCPLCSRKLEYSGKRKQLQPLYPDEVSKIAFIKPQTDKREIITIHFLGFFILLVSLLNMGIDYTLSKTLTWSKISVISIVFLFVIRVLLLYLRRNLYTFYSLTNISLGIYLLILDYFTPGTDWFIEFGMPCLLSLQFASCILFMLFKKIKLKLPRAATCVVVVNIYLTAVDQITMSGLQWSYICTTILLPTALFLKLVSITLQKSYY